MSYVLPRRALYLCDQKMDCWASPICGKECKHTADDTHAKNGPVVNVKEWNERFKVIDFNNELTYWENED